MRDGLSGNEDGILEALARIDELRRQGFDSERIAVEMVAAGAPVPAGDRWSAATVERILEVFDSVRAQGGSPHTEPAPAPATGHAQGEHRDTATDRDTPAAEDTTAATAPTEEHAPPPPAVDGVPSPVVDDASRRRTPVVSAARWAAIGLGLAACGAGGFLAIDAIVGGGPTETRLTGDRATAPTVTAAPTTQPPNPADTMAIRIETDEPEPAASPGDLQPATATIRTDGRLYVEGAFSTEAEARTFVDEAAAVFGRDNVVEAYQVDEAAPAPRVADVALDKPVLFESGTAVIDPDYIAFLEACAGVLELNPHIVMSVTAYTDSVGDEDFNLELSQRRAQAIVDFYREREIGDDQLVAVGVGERDPVASNDTDDGRSQNRRAMLELLNVVGGQAAAAEEDQASG